MLRTSVATLVGWLVFAGVGLADQDKATSSDKDKPAREVRDRPGPEDVNRQINGTIKKVDADKHVLTVTVRRGDKSEDVDFKIPKDARFMRAGQALKGGLKNDAVKAGAEVTVYSSGTGVVQGVQLGGGGGSPIETVGRFEQATGTVKHVDADKGTLTVAVSKGSKTEDQTFHVGKNTRFMAAGGKQVEGGLKGLKKGTEVTIFVEAGTLRGVWVGGPETSPMESAGQREQAMGMIKKVDAEKGVLRVNVLQGRRRGEVEYKINRRTRFVGANNKQLKDGAKSDDLKPGTQVMVISNGGVAQMVRVGR